jgi:transcriptional regulator with XRE-family HTH domain
MGMVDVEELGALLRTRRGDRGLQAVAKEIGGISASTLSRVERGHAPDLRTFAQLCLWLGVSPERFIATPYGGKPSTDVNGWSVEYVAAHLRAQRVLDSKTIDALTMMIRLAFEAARQETTTKSKDD